MIELKAGWAKYMQEHRADAYARLIASLETYAHTSKAHRPSLAKYAATLSRQYDIHITAKALEHTIGRYFRDSAPTDPGPVLDIGTIAQRNLESENVQLREANRRLYEKVVRYKEKAEDLVQATLEGARDAMLSLGPLGPISPMLDAVAEAEASLDFPRPKAEAALWHLTDWQGSKVTTSYNSEVMEHRVRRFCEKAVKITDIQRADHPVDHCVIAFGGDMVEGLFNYPTQPYEIDATLFGQFVRVSRLIVQTVQYALLSYDTVEVVAEWGNHGRIGSRRDAVPRSDNVDRMTYELARQLLQDEPRLTWHDSAEDIQHIEIGNYRALLCHGDEIGRNGFASPMTMIRHCNQWRSGSYPWEFRDVYIGHYHTHNDWSLANGVGSLYQTGSTESDNRYARETMAAAAVPSQRLHFIDKERGRVSAQYKIYLDKD